MPPCIDKHIGDKLFGYELNLLSPDDEALVELHLLQCEYCLARAKRFEAAAEKIREHPEARKLMKRVEADEEAAFAVVPEKRNWFSMSRAAVLVAAAVVVLLLRPWELHFHPTEEVVASEPRIAVMYFDNLADPTDSLRLGEIATDLIITGLSQSHQIQVISTQRLSDVLKLLGYDAHKRIDRSVATQVAQKCNANWMLLGSILQTKPNLVMTAQLIEVATGRVASAARVLGENEHDIFELSDSLSARISGGLSWPVRDDSGLREAKSKTNSLDAYRYYVEGVDAFYRYDLTKTLPAFGKALQLDSTFAMAHYWVASCQWLWYANADTTSIAKALKYSGKATEREKLYIESMQALIVADYSRGIAVLEDLVARYPDEKDAYQLLGICYGRLHQLQKSTDYYFKSLELDSLFADGYAVLIYNLFNLGDYERSVWAAEKYISLRSNEAAPYEFRGDIEAMHGDIDQALFWYRKAVKIDPANSVVSLGPACLMARQYACADSCFRLMAASSESKDRRASGRQLLSLIPLYQGKFQEAKKILDEGIAADKLEQFSLRAYRNKYVYRAFMFEQFGQFDSALQQIEQIKTTYPKNYSYRDKFFGPPYYARLLALNKRFYEAEKVAEDIRLQMADNESIISDYWWTVGNIEMAKENWDRAITDFETALQHSDSEFTYRVSLSYARLKAGKPAEAITELEKGLKNKYWWRFVVPIEAVKAHYYLGMAYELTGQESKAIREYEEFLDIWKNADPGIIEINDARARLTRLMAKS
jgi:tetratricopeptide (TPR) repeat protein